MTDRFFYGKFNLVGMYYLDNRSEMKRKLDIGTNLYFLREAKNKADKNAIAIVSAVNEKFGYVKKSQNEEMAMLMDCGVEFVGEVIELKIKTTGAAAVLAVYCTSKRELFVDALEKYKRFTLLEDVEKLKAPGEYSEE